MGSGSRVWGLEFRVGQVRRVVVVRTCLSIQVEIPLSGDWRPRRVARHHLTAARGGLRRNFSREREVLPARALLALIIGLTVADAALQNDVRHTRMRSRTHKVRDDLRPGRVPANGQGLSTPV